MLYKLLSVPLFATILVRLSLLVKLIKIGGEVRFRHLFMNNDKIRMKIHRKHRHLSITEGSKREPTEDELLHREDLLQKAVDMVTLERMVHYAKKEKIMSINDPKWVFFEGGKDK